MTRFRGPYTLEEAVKPGTLIIALLRGVAPVRCHRGRARDQFVAWSELKKESMDLNRRDTRVPASLGSRTLVAVQRRDGDELGEAAAYIEAIHPGANVGLLVYRPETWSRFRRARRASAVGERHCVECSRVDRRGRRCAPAADRLRQAWAAKSANDPRTSMCRSAKLCASARSRPARSSARFVKNPSRL